MSAPSPELASSSAGPPPTRPALVHDRDAGLRAAAEGRLVEAERLLVHVVSRDPGDARAWNALGVTLVRQGEVARAVEALTRALAADPRLAEAHLNLAVALERQGRGGPAPAHYRAFLRHAEASDPRRGEVGRRLAELAAPRAAR